MNIDREQFTKWLEGKVSDEIIGTSRNQYCCPVTRYITITQDVRRCNVTSSYTKTVDNYGNITISDHPTWLATLINRVDTFGESVSVTARQVLTILEEIPK